MPYKHGAIANIIPSQDTLPPSGVATLPVYIGTAPVQQLADSSQAINKPVLVRNFDEAKAKLGYSDDWTTFSLCEAMQAHFKNKIGNIGPIILVNVMDPSEHTTPGTTQVTLVNRKGFITDPAVLSTMAVAGATPGEDFTAEYQVDGRILFTAIDPAIVSPVTVSYQKMSIDQVEAADIIGGKDATTGKRTGISCVELIYQQTGMIPTIITALGWSEQPSVYEELVSKTQKINGKWDAVCVVDIDSDAAKTIAEAIAWKEDNNYTSKFSKPCWPKVKDGARVYHLSTMTIVRMQQTDFFADNTPYITPSNKQIMANGTVLSDESTIEFDELQANDLNAKGITTAIYSGGNWRVWGPHMGNYAFGADIKPEDKFDSSIRMLQWLGNAFVSRYMADVDTPFNRKFVESVLDDSQVWLNGLVAEGKLLFGSIEFIANNNPITEMVEGNFVFDIGTTTTPPGKSLTFNIQYTTEGLSTLFGGDQ